MGALRGSQVVAGLRGGGVARWRRAGVAVAALAMPLAAFGIAAAPASAVSVPAYRGEVLISEFRFSGPSGPGDQYVELYNAGAPLSLAGFKLSASSAGSQCRFVTGPRCRSSVTIPANAPVLPTAGSYLITAQGYSLGAVHPSDLSVLSIGSQGLRLTAPDGTLIDAVGFAGARPGFYSGTPLGASGASPFANQAWVRLDLNGVPSDTRNNATDFHLVTTTAGMIAGSRCLTWVGPVCPALGTPSPGDTGTADQDNRYLRSALLDPAQPQSGAPNLEYVPGNQFVPGRLTIRRTITNSSAVTIRTAEVHITSLSELNGAPEPGAITQPLNPAQLRLINPRTRTSHFAITGGQVIRVENLSMDPPAMAIPGGGLNTRLQIPLPRGGLAPGASVSISLTFGVDVEGFYWFGYNVDALATTASPIILHGSPRAAAAAALAGVPAPGTGLAPGAPSRYAGGHGFLR